MPATDGTARGRRGPEASNDDRRKQPDAERRGERALYDRRARADANRHPRQPEHQARRGQLVGSLPPGVVRIAGHSGGAEQGRRADRDERDVIDREHQPRRHLVDRHVTARSDLEYHMGEEAGLDCEDDGAR